jgi:hypothetical protein
MFQNLGIAAKTSKILVCGEQATSKQNYLYPGSNYAKAFGVKSKKG